MYVLPSSCPAFGFTLPAAGTRVVFDVVMQPKTGKPMADNVRPEPSATSEAASPACPTASQANAASQANERAGTMGRSSGRFGFIKQDEGQPDMFVLPISCAALGGKLPATGTRVVYDVVTDSRTGRPRANEVKPEDARWSTGGQGHRDGACRPCGYFYSSQGCRDSSHCRFCHFCPRFKRKYRRKARRKD